MSIAQLEGNKKYTYYLNGLLICSEIRLPEVVELQDVVYEDYKLCVTITVGTVPAEITNVAYKNPVLSIGLNDVLVNIEGVATYYIKQGKEVVIQPFDGTEEPAVRLYILSIVLGVLLHQNGILALHAATIKVGNGAVIVAGHSGVGKSTLALGLAEKGYKIISDDITSVYFDNDHIPYVFPGISCLKLWALSLEEYGYRVEAFEKIRNEIDKYNFPVKQDNQGMLPLKAVFFINETAEKALEKQEVESGIGKIKKLKAHTYRYKLVQHLQKTGAHFGQSAMLASKVPFFNVSRSTAVTPAEFAGYMEQEFLCL